MATIDPSTPANNQTPAPEGVAAKTPLLDAEQVKQAILKQVEFYFSTQNLPSDSFLLSKMDAEHYVPLSLISSFGKVKELTTDAQVLLEALQMSNTLELSADHSKLRLKEERRRNRLILHNLPAETTDQDLKELFAQGDFAPEIKSDVNNCWFVSFETEESAAAGLDFIRKQKIHDKSIRARLKPEPLLRNIYTPVESNPAQYMQNAAPYMGYPSWTPIMYYDQNGEPIKSQYDGKDRRYKGKGQRNKDYRGKPYDSNKKRTTGQRKGKGRENKKQAPVQLGPSDFPPLPSATSGKNSGYSKEFKQYTQDEITQSLGKLEAKKPDNANEFPFTEEANTKLETTSPVAIDSSDLSQVKKSEKVKKQTKASPESAPKEQPKDTSDNAEAKGSWSQIAKTSPSKESSGSK